MNLAAKLQPVIIVAAALLGLGLGAVTPIDGAAAAAIEPCLVVMLFFLFLSVDGRQFANSFKNVRFTACALAVNFVWTPLFAFALGRAFFGESLDMQIGLMMMLVTPCTDWYLVFTGLAHGDVALGASILPLNLLLQIVLMPAYLQLFYGSQMAFAQASVIASIVAVLVVPLAASLALKGFARTGHPRILEALRSRSDDAQLAFLCLAIVFMFASQSAEVLANPQLLVRMLAPLLLFFVANFAIVRALGRIGRFPAAETTALNFTTMARNSPLSLAIAVAAFPARPLIALALVIGPLIELPVLALAAWGINRLQGDARERESGQ